MSLPLVDPGTYAIVVRQGTTWRRTFTWRYGDTEDPVDLTDCTAVLQVRIAELASTVVLELSTENGRIELGGTAGTIRMQLNPAETSVVRALSYVYDLEIVAGDGGATPDVVRLLEGPFTLDQEVTRVA